MATAAAIVSDGLCRLPTRVPTPTTTPTYTAVTLAAARTP